MDPQDIAKLKAFVSLIQTKPELLHSPQLTFFKTYLQSMGANLPPEPMPEPESTKDDAEQEEANTVEPEVDSDNESDVELDSTGVIEKDEDLGLDMGDSSKAPCESDMEKADEFRMQAQRAFGEGNIEESLGLFTDAIKANPQSAVLFAKRAQCLLKLDKPFNALKDCSKAIELNPDQALAYRLRGRAHRLLGEWEEAARDLNTSLKIDFNEEGDEWLKEVAPNAKKLYDHRRKYERKREEKELKERRDRIRRAQEERKKQAEFNSSEFKGMPGGMPGGIPNAGGMFAEWMKDPEIREALSDPEVAAALQGMSTDPSNILKSQSNPKVMAVMAKIAAKMGFMPSQ